MNIRITDFMSQEELLIQLAEEAAELSHAALKLRRVMDGTNPTPVSYANAVKGLNEEIADVRLCLEQIHCTNENVIRDIRNSKLARWIMRLIESGGNSYAQKDK